MITEVAFFTYPVTDLERSRRFYEGVLGLKPTLVHGSWIEYDIGATTLAIGQHPSWLPSPNGASAALEVDNFEETIAHLKAAQVPFGLEPLETPVCHMAVVLDPDKSQILIHKRKVL